MDNNSPLYENDYEKRNKRLYPLVEIEFQCGKQRFPITTLADTGCDSGFVLFDYELDLLKKNYKEFEIGEKMNDEPVRFSVADGHIVEADVYYTFVELSGEKKPIEFTVIHANQIVGRETEIETINEVLPLIGRNFLNHFDVMFKGKKQKIVIFK